MRDAHGRQPIHFPDPEGVNLKTGATLTGSECCLRVTGGSAQRRSPPAIEFNPFGIRLPKKLCQNEKQELKNLLRRDRRDAAEMKTSHPRLLLFLAILSFLCLFVSIGSRAQNQTERAYQDREILYELQTPLSHSFRITHDYIVRKAGEKYYFNVVRAGSHMSDPESLDLDSGEKLKWEVINGKQAVERKLPITDQIKDDTEIVITHLARPLATGSTNRIRLMETYADPKSYYLDGEELVWDSSFGRLRNTVVLPAGWYLTSLASPATIQTLRDGRVSIYVVNPRNDDVRVYFRARRRPAVALH